MDHSRLRPKTIEAYARAIRRIGGYFDHRIDDLTEVQLTDYFADLLESHSWSAVKLDLYGLEFYYTYVLHPTAIQRSPVDFLVGVTHDRLQARF